MFETSAKYSFSDWLWLYDVVSTTNNLKPGYNTARRIRLHKTLIKPSQ